jgi:radical SAM family uncharacterized protein
VIVHETLERILPTVRKPGRYTGGEWNSVVKDWTTCQVRWALAFPDIYEIGMSNFGLAILYDVLNREPEVLAERVFAPWTDMEQALRAADLPLFSLESRRPLGEFDVIGFTLPYEQLYTNLLNMLDMAGLPVLAAERDERHPRVIAGGGAVYNPEPMADFVDAFALGDGEEIVLDITHAIREGKERGDTRKELLRRLAEIPGVYVPRFYQVVYQQDGTVAKVLPIETKAQMPARKRIASTLPPPLTRPVVPFLDTIHNRGVIEIQRGCTRGCRFCHAGMVYRPVRERPVEEVLQAVDEIVANTGYDEIALLSLSSSDYSQIETLVGELVARHGNRHEGRHLSISLPSLRIESVSVALMEQLRETGRRSSFTFAPEAATERLRGVINKPIADEDLLSVVEEVYSRGWKTVKLYFMIGHPTQTLDDVAAIVDLAKQVRGVGRRVLGRKSQVNVSVSTLVPKPHTPFQWVPLADEDEIRAQQDYLKENLRGPGLKLNWNRYQETLLEAVLSRGDRRLGAAILRAWELGARFDGWSDQFKVEAWRQAFEDTGLEIGFYTRRARSLDEVFPWDHIDAGVSKRYLAQDYEASTRGETRADCREQCYACGILTAFREEQAGLPAGAWSCPPVAGGAR